MRWREKTWRTKDASRNTERDRITCSVCGFPGVDMDTTPGESLAGSTSYVTNGTVYAWTNADDDITLKDKEVIPVPNVAVSCPFCGAERFLDGHKGSGHAIPK